MRVWYVCKNSYYTAAAAVFFFVRDERTADCKPCPPAVMWTLPPCRTVNPAPLLYCGTFILGVVVGQGVRFTDGPGAVVGVQTLDTDRCPYSVLIGVGVYLDVTVVIWWTSYKMDIQTTLPYASNHCFTINN